jgi:hypothetical protein
MSKRKGDEKDADFTGWRDKDDNSATKKKARVMHRLAKMEYKATCDNSFVVMQRFANPTNSVWKRLCTK